MAGSCCGVARSLLRLCPVECMFAAVVGVMCLTVLNVYGQNPDRQSVAIQPDQEVRSQRFVLEPGQSITVQAASDDTGFAVDSYVYDSEGVLVGKDDEESLSTSFVWHAVSSGSYYVLARNVSERAGVISIAVGRDKGPAEAKLC